MKPHRIEAALQHVENWESRFFCDLAPPTVFECDNQSINQSINHLTLDIALKKVNSDVD